MPQVQYTEIPAYQPHTAPSSGFSLCQPEEGYASGGGGTPGNPADSQRFYGLDQSGPYSGSSALLPSPTLPDPRAQSVRGLPRTPPASSGTIFDHSPSSDSKRKRRDQSTEFLTPSEKKCTSCSNFLPLEDSHKTCSACRGGSRRRQRESRKRQKERAQSMPRVSKLSVGQQVIGNRSVSRDGANIWKNIFHRDGELVNEATAGKPLVWQPPMTAPEPVADDWYKQIAEGPTQPNAESQLAWNEFLKSLPANSHQNTGPEIGVADYYATRNQMIPALSPASSSSDRTNSCFQTPDHLSSGNYNLSASYGLNTPANTFPFNEFSAPRSGGLNQPSGSSPWPSPGTQLKNTNFTPVGDICSVNIQPPSSSLNSLMPYDHAALYSSPNGLGHTFNMYLQSSMPDTGYDQLAPEPNSDPFGYDGR